MSYDSVILATANLKAYYILNESSGLIAHDATANHYDATVSSGVIWGQPGATLDYETSAWFGPSDSLTLPTSLNITTFTALTIEFRMKLSGDWFSVAITTDGTVGNTLLYLNGTLYASSSGDIVEIAGLFDFVGSVIASGYAAKLAIYNAVLSSSVIAAHYQLTIIPVPAVNGSGSTEDRTLYKSQLCRVFNSAGIFLDVWNDAPLLSGFKEVINGATTPMVVNLPRTFDAFDLPSQPNSKGTIAIGNIVEYRIYGPGLPQTGKVRYLGTIEKYEPSIDEQHKEVVAVTITPYSAVIGDRYVTTETIFGRSSVSATLKGALTSGNVYTSLTVKALSQPLLTGDTPTLTSGIHTQTLTVAQDASIGDTIVYVNSFTANFSYPVARSTLTHKTKSALTNGTAYTSIAVSKLTRNVFAGDVYTLTSGAHNQTITVASNTAIGATSIPFTSFTANFSYPIGSTLTFVVTGTTLAFDLSTVYVDPVDMFNYFFNTIDTSTGLGKTYADPLTLDPANPASSGNMLQYTFKIQTLISAFEKIRLMLPGLNWFYRANLDKTVTLNQAPTTPQHIFYLGQHFSTIKYSQDITNLKNVAVIQGAGDDVIGNASGSDLTLYGQRVVAKADSRITDNITASVVAQGYINIYDQIVTRAPIRIFDYRGDYNSGLGYDIESIQVGDSIEIIDTTGINLATLWDGFTWDNASWNFSAGAIFNTVVQVYELTYNFDSIDLSIGSPKPNHSRALTEILRDLSDFTLG